MYPNIIVAFNIERHTMIGKLIIHDTDVKEYDHVFDPTADDMYSDAKKYFDDEDDDSSDDDDSLASLNYDAGSDFMDNYHTGDILSIGTKWFGLPDPGDMISKFGKKRHVLESKSIEINVPRLETPVYVDIEEG